MTRFGLVARITITFICLLILASPLNAAGESKHSVFKYEVVKSISPYELWHSSQHTISASSGIIDYYAMDSEDTSIKGNRYLRGWILAGISDLGTTPLVIQLWTDQSFDIDQPISNQITTTGDRNEITTAIFSVRSISCSRKPSCEVRGVAIAVNGENGNVYVDGKFVGNTDIE